LELGIVVDGHQRLPLLHFVADFLVQDQADCRVYALFLLTASSSKDDASDAQRLALHLPYVTALRTSYFQCVLGSRQPCWIIDDGVITTLFCDHVSEFCQCLPRVDHLRRQVPSRGYIGYFFSKQEHPSAKFEAQLPQIRRAAAPQSIHYLFDFESVPD